MCRNAFPVVKKDEKNFLIPQKKWPEPEGSSRLLIFSYIRLPPWGSSRSAGEEVKKAQIPPYLSIL